jgi:6-phosphofructokinase
VLTDAASMPKYWHFVRLMGRQPSNEVLECALQTHPNVVIIAEEYGAGNKTLLDVVNDIADVVVKRSNMGKNFGSVLIPDGLLLHLPNMNALMNELSALIKEAEDLHQLQDLQVKSSKCY